MDSCIFTSTGEQLPDISHDEPILNITWAKSFDQVYCHHALLSFSFVTDGLFPNEYFRISIGIRQQTIENGKIKNFHDKKLFAHIPGKYNNGKIYIPLNSVKILDSLCENSWTSLKNGKRGATKSFPISISVNRDNKTIFDFSFHHLKEKFPFTICENEFTKLKNDEKLETLIVLR